MSDLPKKENFECLSSFVENLVNKQAGKQDLPKNLKEWFYYNFGKGIAEKYLIPYNEKIWKYPTEKMSLVWEGRIPNPPVEDVIKSSIGIKTEGYLYQLNFCYPRIGGIQAVIDKLKGSVGDRISTSFNVKNVKRESDKWLVSDGEQKELFDKVVSTIPMNELIKVMCAPREVKDAAINLKFNSLVCVMIGLDVEKINDLSWLYIPDPIFLPHRVSFPSNYSPVVAPHKKSSVLAEITCAADSEIWKMHDDELADRVVDDLVHLKIIKKEDVRFSIVRKTRYAYVINDLDYAENTRVVRNFLVQEGISSVGRFGEFSYLNMDACVRRAIQYVETNS